MSLDTIFTTENTKINIMVLLALTTTEKRFYWLDSYLKQDLISFTDQEIVNSPNFRNNVVKLGYEQAKIYAILSTHFNELRLIGHVLDFNITDKIYVSDDLGIRIFDLNTQELIKLLLCHLILLWNCESHQIILRKNRKK